MTETERDPLGPCCDDPRWSGERGGPGYLRCHMCDQPYRSGYRVVKTGGWAMSARQSVTRQPRQHVRGDDAGRKSADKQQRGG